MTDLVPISIEQTTTDVALTDLEDEARSYLTASRAASTVRAYASDWRAFTAWCSAHGLDALPAAPTTVVLYMTDLARTAKTATIRRRLSSISVAHQAAGVATPTADILVRSTWSGIRRTNGTAQTGKNALLTDDIRAMVMTLPETLLGRRDACLLLLGFSASRLRCGVANLSHST
jgi:site-specific recombinase XerD